jgi:hypothetical protein
MAACVAMPVKIRRSFSVNALVAICESRFMMPRSSSPWSNGTHIVDRMPCMMMLWAPEKRLSMVASEESTACFSRMTSLMMLLERMISSFCSP